MSLKQLLGLNEAGISEPEIMGKFIEAQKRNLDEIEFITQDGAVIKIHLPHIPFDPILFKDTS